MPGVYGAAVPVSVIEPGVRLQEHGELPCRCGTDRASYNGSRRCMAADVGHRSWSATVRGSRWSLAEAPSAKPQRYFVLDGVPCGGSAVVSAICVLSLIAPETNRASG